MFIDTNVLVYSRILEAPQHETARAMLERALQGEEPLRISRQVVREYLAVVTRPQTWPVAISREDALDDVNRLVGSFEVLEDGPSDRAAGRAVYEMCPWEDGRFTTRTSWRRCSCTGSAGC